MKMPIQIQAWPTLLTIISCSIVAYLLLFFKLPTSDTTKRMGCLDGLRGFLALGVFFFHYVKCYYSHLTGVWDNQVSTFYILSGKASVTLFFAITGFLFWYRIWVNQGKIDWFKLYVSRIFRIVPLYWFVVSVIVLVVFTVGGFSVKVPPFLLLKQIAIWLSFLWTPDINAFHDTGRILLYVQWTLVYEWVFYFSLPILAIAICYSKGKPLIPFLMVTAVIVGTLKPINIPFFNINTKYFIYFLTGALAASVYQNDKIRAIAQKKIVSVIAIGSIFVLFAFFNTVYGFWQSFLLAIFFIPIALGNSILGLLRLPIFILLGDLSYSIYLIHGIILYLIFTVLFPSFFNYKTSLFVIYAGMSITGMIVVCISWLTHYLLEKPFMDLGKNIVNRSMNH